MKILNFKLLRRQKATFVKAWMNGFLGRSVDPRRGVGAPRVEMPRALARGALLSGIFMLGLISTCDAQPERPIQNFLTIEEINQQKLEFGTYHTEGYVVSKKACEPCPKPGLCAPCPPDHIVISMDKVPTPEGKTSDRELMIFVEDANLIKSNNKYRFLIQILDVKTISQKLNNIKLIYFELVDESKK